MVLFGQKWLYSDKSGCICKGCCIRAKVAVVGQEWLFSGKRVFLRAKVVLLGQKRFYSGKSGYIRTKEVVIQQSGCIRAKVVLFGL